MSTIEVKSILQNQNEQYKNTWEQVRYIAYVTAATNSDKIKTPTDLLKFDWEKIQETKLTPAERMKREQEFLSYLQNNDRK